MERNAMLVGVAGAFGVTVVVSAVVVGGVWWTLNSGDGGDGDEPRRRADRVEEPARGEGVPNPALEKAQERMAQPDAKYAGDLISPMATIRRTMQLMGGEADTISKPADALIGKLREQRRDPAKHPWAELEGEVNAFSASINASQWGTDPKIAPELAKITEILAAHAAAAAE